METKVITVYELRNNLEIFVMYMQTMTVSHLTITAF